MSLPLSPAGTGAGGGDEASAPAAPAPRLVLNRPRTAPAPSRRAAPEGLTLTAPPAAKAAAPAPAVAPVPAPAARATPAPSGTQDVDDDSAIELDWTAPVAVAPIETAAPVARGEGRARWRMARRERVTVGGFRQRWTTTLLAVLAVLAVLAGVAAYAVHVRASATVDPFESDTVVRFTEPGEESSSPQGEPVGPEVGLAPTEGAVDESASTVSAVPEVALG